MSTDLTIFMDMQMVAEVADRVASESAFQTYRNRKTTNTRRRQLSDLSAFADYLAETRIARTAQQLYDLPEAWTGMSFGIIEGFLQWQLQRGYAIGSINVRLATVKKYCALAVRSGALAPQAYQLIRTVQSFSHKDGRNLDAKREQTRIGNKKAFTTLLCEEQARILKTTQGESAQARKDALLMCFLLDHGFRCGELAALNSDMIDLRAGYVTFYREKVDLTQTHLLSADTHSTTIAYLSDKPAGRVFGNVRGINDRVRYLGKRLLGVGALSPHDCRHYWATIAMRHGTDVKALQTAGGWKSPAMPLRYAEAASIANAGVKLGREE